MRGRPLRILVAEDSAADRLRLRRCLERPGVSLSLHVVATYADFVAALQESFDCAILDFHLCDCEADQLLRELTERDPHCPAIVISSSGAQDVVIRSLRNGTVDFLPKSEALEGDALWERVMLVLERRRTKDRSRRKRTERRRQLLRLAETDPLTGLGNRRYLQRCLQAWAGEPLAEPGAVIILDIDRFKSINDQYGHSVGDEVLQRVARQINIVLPEYGCAARWGGEEFLIVLRQATLAEAMAFAEGLRRRVAAAPHHPAVANVSVTASLGVAPLPCGSSVERVIESADQAMYLAKRSGRNRVCPASLVEFEQLAVGLRERHPEARLAELLQVAAPLLGPTQYEHLTAHAQRVRDLAVACGRTLGADLAELERLRMAGQMHDLGKWIVPEEILSKPTLLEPEERALLDGHAAHGAEMGLRLGIDARTSCYIRFHHRWYDEPLPSNLPNSAEVGRAASILAAADAYVAMTSARPYQSAKSEVEAMRELLRCTNRQFDPLVVEAIRELATIGEPVCTRRVAAAS